MKQGRPYIIALLVVSLLLAGISRRWAQHIRDNAIIDPLNAGGGAATTADTGNLVNMDSYALALLLGGLRGPLVMFLWSSSESQKSAHDLEDFDTKVEWIRLLQPEFDTVHLFQIWNKAYNVSAQMANLPNKYATILDAIDYADRMDRQRPDDINIIDSTANVYGEKLGGDQLPADEREYFYRRISQESQAPRDLVRVIVPASQFETFLPAARAAGMDEPEQAADADDQQGSLSIVLTNSLADALEKQFKPLGVTFTALPKRRNTSNETVRRNRLEPMLDENGNILPELLKPTHPRPADLAADQPWYYGSKLEYLSAYQPFPYGITPDALGYDYYKRAQMLQIVAHEQHVQLTPYVVDSRPAVAMKAWGAEAAMDGRRAELRFFGMDDHGPRLDLELRAPGAGDQTAAPPVSDPAAGPRALYDYELASHLYRDDQNEIRYHLRRFPNDLGVFSSHIDDVVAFEAGFQADHDFLSGLLDSSKRQADWQSASANYIKSRDECVQIILTYYVDSSMQQAAFPKDAQGVRLLPEEILRLPAARQREILQKVLDSADAFYKTRPDDHGDERNEYMTYIKRCESRLQVLAAGK